MDASHFSAQLPSPKSPGSPHFDLSSPVSLSLMSGIEVPCPAPSNSPNNRRISAATSSSSNDTKPKSKKGRKKLHVTEEQKKEADVRRAQRNRFFARENRERKKQYVLSLEHHVDTLNAELWACKCRLAEYEARERAQHMNFQQLYNRLAAEAQRFEEQRMTRLVNIFPAAGLSESVRVAAEEKQKLTDMMSETLIDFTVTKPCRYLMYLIEHGKEIFAEKPRPQTQTTERGKLIEGIQKDGLSIILTTTDLHNHLQTTIKGLKRSMDQYHVSLRNLTDQTSQMERCLLENVFPRMSECSIRNLSMAVHILMDPHALSSVTVVAQAPSLAHRHSAANEQNEVTAEVRAHKRHRPDEMSE